MRASPPATGSSSAAEEEASKSRFRRVFWLSSAAKPLMDWPKKGRFRAPRVDTRSPPGIRLLSARRELESAGPALSRVTLSHARSRTEPQSSVEGSFRSKSSYSTRSHLDWRLPMAPLRIPRRRPPMTLAQAVRTPLRSTLLALAVSSLGLASATGDARAEGTVVISQIYGGGGNTGSDYTHDFIELLNRSVFPVDVTGWTVQYASATGSSWTSTALSGTIPPGGYFLIEEGTGGLGSTPLPTPDAAGGINLSATSGKI